MSSNIHCAWMDQGGTFTDVVHIDGDGRWHVSKVLSDAADLERLAHGAGDVRRGTTIATNALLERTLRPVVLVTTAGFEDMLEFGVQVRPVLFARTVRRVAPLGVRVVSIPGRLGADGQVVEPLDLTQLEGRLRAAGTLPAAVAVALVHGPRRPAWVETIADRCRAMGVAQVTTGVDVAPSAGFLVRMRTAVLDAALTPLLPRNRGRWMCSDGRLASHDSPDWRGSRSVLSGPAGGVVSTAAHARATGDPRGFIGLDMGGTSTDLCRVPSSRLPVMTDQLVVDGLRLATAAVRVDTIAAGGGSMVATRGGIYTVGPGSAGAHPGPACYGRGGPLALTDAEAVLGRLPGFPHVAGPSRDQPLDLAAARMALQRLDPGRAVERIAAGVRRVAHSRMARAIRRLVAEDAADPASHILVAFGGAGPAHACGVAHELGIREVHIPILAGVWSAVGIGRSRPGTERRVAVIDSVSAAIDDARSRLPPGGSRTLQLLAQHVGTTGVIALPIAEDGLQEDREVIWRRTATGGHQGCLSGALRASFDQEHQRLFGFVRPEHPVEVVAVRMVVEQALRAGPTVRVPPPVAHDESVRGWFDGGWQTVPLHAVGTHPSAGWTVTGPAMVILPGSTVVLEPGWSARHAGDHLVLEADADRMKESLGEHRDPVHTAVFGARLAGIAEAMGETLARLARSVSIRDRRDFSCALFDAGGCLAVNAPHVPVHLGAMGETIRALLETHAHTLKPGQAWVTNDPYAGGSHLPDITVMQPIFDRRGERVAWAACRGHHVDVGGIRAGSMPPDACTIEEEGVVIPHHLLVDDTGAVHFPELVGCRQLDDVQADLLAQVAACRQGTTALERLLSELDSPVVTAQLAHLQAVAAEAVADALSSRRGRFEGREVFDDGTELTVAVDVGEDGQDTVVSIGAPPHPRNLNAPAAVARAAVLYVLRCLIGVPIPLNEGVLKRIQIEVNPGGLFDPQPPAAVAGGNVETSQRLVDALFRALGIGAAGQGTMNNLTVGTAAGAWYETIGGGAGATPEGPGASAVQVHMTNTRATDVEVLERRFPVRLESVRRRVGSGGAGRHRGGDGLEKTWRFLAAAEVAVLAERRAAGAPGLDHGGRGRPGRDLRDVGQGWEAAPTSWQAKPGDRLRIQTPGGGGWGRAADDQRDEPTH
ncbi:MAG: 5-oxoprolinase [Deltaproteobacteria bacterium]|nr:5-oxoprolinase [Deltaproteobacteria bacterium]HCH66821.1 5-oxoprolinase [Deltaproteobacteria bacterium]